MASPHRNGGASWRTRRERQHATKHLRVGSQPFPSRCHPGAMQLEEIPQPPAFEPAAAVLAVQTLHNP